MGHRQTTPRMRERVTSRYSDTVVTAYSTDRGKCSIKTLNRDVSFRKFILWTAREIKLTNPLFSALS